MEMILYKLLDIPFVYKTVQYIFTGNGENMILEEIKKLLHALPPGKKLLDVGCGPESWLFQLGLYPTGLDFTSRYIDKYRKSGATAYIGDATQLPFGDYSFDGVWSIGLLHHMNDQDAKKAVKEMFRVTKNGGYVAIIDAVLPISLFNRPGAYILQKLDRGKHVRSEEKNLELFPNLSKWNIHRFSYTKIGLENITAWRIK